MDDSRTQQGNSKTLTARFLRALEFAFELHKDQYRKGTDTPYFSHLLAVTSVVCEDGGDEDQAIAAILHDAVEDHGGYQTLFEIKQEFGERVADIVATCSDSFVLPKPSWEKRKKDYLFHLPTASPEARRVSLADKLHNARSILRDLECMGDSIWERFNGGKEGTLWYYKTLAEIFNEEQDGYMAGELKRVVYQIEKFSTGRAASFK
jgi:(p)ppGpp synthase/HD superfamily hydrolase